MAPQSLDDARRRKPATKDDGTRIPPHNLEAEESLLGAMLLSRDAIDSAKGLEPGDFYKPAHGMIFAGIMALVAKGEPCDLVTVADELRRQGTLELTGGPPALIALQANTPVVGNASRYAHIVKEHAHACRLIRAFEKGQAASWENDLRSASSALDEAAAILTGAATEKGIAFEDVAAVLRGEVPPVVPTMLRRDDGKALIYPGLLHWLMGEHGKGKTMLAVHAVAEILGLPVQTALFDAPADPASPPAVMYLDWEGNRRIIGDRLRQQGVQAEAVESRFLYYRPPPLSKMITQHLWKTVVERGVVLVVCDGVAKALARQGWNEDSAGEVLAWIEILISRPWLDRFGDGLSVGLFELIGDGTEVGLAALLVVAAPAVDAMEPELPPEPIRSVRADGGRRPGAAHVDVEPDRRRVVLSRGPGPHGGLDGPSEALGLGGGAPRDAPGPLGEVGGEAAGCGGVDHWPWPVKCGSAAVRPWTRTTRTAAKDEGSTDRTVAVRQGHAHAAGRGRQAPEGHGPRGVRGRQHAAGAAGRRLPAGAGLHARPGGATGGVGTGYGAFPARSARRPASGVLGAYPASLGL